MKRLILIFFIVVSLLLFGCSISQNEETTQNDDLGTQEVTVVQTDETKEETAPIETPFGEECKLIPRIFKTEQELKDAIKNAPQSDEGQDYAVGGLDYYFVPAAVPDGAHLSYIAVKDVYITFWYSFDEEPDPYWERTFHIVWNRNKEVNGTDEIEYSIGQVEPWGSYNGGKEYVCMEVEWVQYGYSFYSIVPAWFTNEDIEKYCVVEKVVVEKLK